MSCLLSPAQAAARLGLSVKTVWNQLHDARVGKRTTPLAALPWRRVGRSLRLEASELERFLVERPSAGAPEPTGGPVAEELLLVARTIKPIFPVESARVESLARRLDAESTESAP